MGNNERMIQMKKIVVNTICSFIFIVFYVDKILRKTSSKREKDPTNDAVEKALNGERSKQEEAEKKEFAVKTKY